MLGQAIFDARLQQDAQAKFGVVTIVVVAIEFASVMQVAGTETECQFPAPTTRRGHVAPHAVHAEGVEAEMQITVAVSASLESEGYASASASAFVEYVFIVCLVVQSQEMVIGVITNLQFGSNQIDTAAELQHVQFS